MHDFEDVLAEIAKDLTGKFIARSGYAPIGKVVRVDQTGAHLESGGRITLAGLPFYRPVAQAEARPQ